MSNKTSTPYLGVLTEKNALKQKLGSYYHPKKDHYRDGLCPVGTIPREGYEYIKKNEPQVFSNDYNVLFTVTKEICDLIPSDIKEKINKKFESIPGFFSEDIEFEGFSDGEIKMLEGEVSKILKTMENEAAETKIVEKFHDLSGGYYEEFEIITQNNKINDVELYNTAKKQSKRIFNDLSFLNSKFSQQIEQYELDEGDIDNTEIHSVGYSKNIFEDIDLLPKYQLDVCILIDESGSMSGSKIKKAKEAALALILALEGNSHINLFVYGHTADSGYSSKKAVQIYKYYNTLEKLTDYRKIFHCKARGNNADGYAIDRVAKEMKTNSSEKLMIVISDGQPNASMYSGASAENHVKKIVTNLEKKGVFVIQVCIDNVESSPRMFKHFVPYDKDGKFFDKLKTILQKKLIKFASII